MLLRMNVPQSAPTSLHALTAFVTPDKPPKALKQSGMLLVDLLLLRLIDFCELEVGISPEGKKLLVTTCRLVGPTLGLEHAGKLVMSE